MRHTYSALIFLLLLCDACRASEDKAQANAFDNAWENAWVQHCRTLFNGGSGKTAGFVLQIGDSITHSNPNAQWPRYGSGKTSEDSAVCSWAGTSNWGTGTADVNSKNGYYLAAADTASRGMTAASGINCAEFLSGDGNGGTAMPAQTITANAKVTIADSSYNNNIHIDTLVAAFADAQFAVLMLGTNDANNGRSTNDFITDLTSIVSKLEAKNIVPVLSTIPPMTSSGAPSVDSYNTAIRNLCQTRGLPLIDFNAEILARRPNTTWQNTIIDADGVHPTASGGTYGAASDPYADGGDATTHRTGPACASVGYLLRSWLTVQKLKEVKSYVVDGNNPPAQPVITTVDVTPATVSLVAGTSQQFSATVKDQFGNTMQASVTWSANNGASISSSGLQSTTAAGSITVTATAGTVSGTATVTVTTAAGPPPPPQNQKPAFNSPPQANPNPAAAGSLINFNTLATDPDGDTITYSWTFGDGTNATGANPSHTYALAGDYLVHAFAGDSKSGVTEAIIIVTVTSAAVDPVVTDPGTGSDGGTDTVNSNSPDTSSDKWLPLIISKFSAKFTSIGGKDSVSLSGALVALPAGFNPATLPAELKIGGAAASFTLDAKGKSKARQGTLALKIKMTKDKATRQSVFAGGDVPFSAKLSKGAWAAAWNIDTAADTFGSPLTLPVTLKLGNSVYGLMSQSVLFNKSGKGGKFYY